MKEPCAPCPYERAYDVQFQSLTGALEELKNRVRCLESTLARGVLLLVANLVGVAISLAQQLVGV
ncbi:MAG: hypothetical protein GY851_07235 [bacterium]|nr:hypothetical protein [bacterium]